MSFRDFAAWIVASAFTIFFLPVTTLAQTVGPNYQCNFTVFPVPGSGPGFAPVANNINRHDLAVGYFPVAPNGLRTKGFIRHPDGSINTLFINNSHSTFLKGLNDMGTMVGLVIPAANQPGHGFRFSQGNFHAINFPGGSNTSANGVNNNEDIVGFYNDAQNTQHGFLLKSGTFTTIDVAGASGTSATGINDSGIIVGSYTTPSLMGHGFILSQGQTTTVDYPGAADTTLNGINNQSAMVGTFFSNTQVGGFVYLNGVFRQVVLPNSTASSQIETDGINEFGDISGSIMITPTDLEAYIGTGCH